MSVERILAAADTIAEVTGRIDRQAAVIAEIRKLHQRMHCEDNYAAWDYCEHCDTDWPCDTMRIVEAVPL